MTGPDGTYETPSEYIRDLIRRDMENRGSDYVREAILDGYRDMAAGHYFKSTGDFKRDMTLLEEKDQAGWT
ncbi:MAG: CopG family transcriptional regulator [Nitrospinaceae bacterium]